MMISFEVFQPGHGEVSEIQKWRAGNLTMLRCVDNNLPPYSIRQRQAEIAWVSGLGQDGNQIFVRTHRRLRRSQLRC
jgi:hypothetical protein